MKQFNGKPVEILLVEDNPGDVELTKIAFKDSKISNNIHVVEDGEKAMDFLYKRNQFNNEVIPDIIFLDLNLPKKDGRQVLEEIKLDSTFAGIPVVIMTSSKAEQDILQSYQLHANCYLVKPVTLEKFAEIIRSIEQFWFTVVVLPDTKE